MARYFLELAYKGSAYHGWQIQQNANSVQAEVEKALKILLGTDTPVTGCGRTDTGVHALKYFAHFESEKDLPHELVFKLNGMLPRDIAVYRAIPVGENAHARFDAVSRSYEYHLHSFKDPFLEGRSAFVHFRLDAAAMNEAAAWLLEVSDFASFCKSGSDQQTTHCKLSQAEVKSSGHRITFYFTADRFLRNMVRAMVGTLIQVGRQSISIQEFKKIVESRDRKQAGMSVDACGLYLVDAEYPFL